MEWRPDHEEEKAGSAHRDLRAGGPLAAGLCGADFPGATIPLALLGVTIYVLCERIKEIRSGEEDDLDNY